MSLTWKFKRLLSSALADLLLWTLWSLTVLTALVLPIYLGASFLLVRDCHPHVNISLSQQLTRGIDVGNLLDQFSPLETSSSSSEPDTKSSVNESSVVRAAQEAPTLIERFISPDLSLRVGDDQVPVTDTVLPRHLLRSLASLVTSMVDKYQLTDASRLCSVNDYAAGSAGLVSLGVRVCSTGLETAVGAETAARLTQWVADLGPDTEDGLVDGLSQGDLVSVLGLLPQMFPDAGQYQQLVQCSQSFV